MAQKWDDGFDKNAKALFALFDWGVVTVRRQITLGPANHFKNPGHMGKGADYVKPNTKLSWEARALGFKVVGDGDPSFLVRQDHWRSREGRDYMRTPSDAEVQHREAVKAARAARRQRLAEAGIA